MKKIAYVFSTLFLVAVVVYFTQGLAYADPTSRVGESCNIPPNNTAGTVVQNSNGALVCKPNNSSDKNAPAPVPIGNSSAGGATFSSGGSGSYSGTCGQLSGVISTGFVKQVLCTDNNGNAVEVIVRNLANYILSLALIVLTVMLGLGFVQVMTGGGSPEALKAGKKRITLAISSIALFVLGRLVLDLFGITGGTFLGVNVATGFSQDTIYQIIRSVWNYTLYFGGFLAVFMVAYGGFTMLTSAGQPQKIQAARRIITYALIGIAGLVSVTLIINLVSLAVGAR